MSDTKRSYSRPALYALAVLGVAALAANVLSDSTAVGAERSDSVSRLNDLSNAFTEISETASPAVVYVEVEKEVRASGRMQPFMGPRGMFPDDFFERFFGQPMPNRPAPGHGRPRKVPYGQGTGFIISPDGYIVTNHHVVNGADALTVKLADGREFDAEIVGSDDKTEIAVIKVDAKNLPTLPFGDSDALRVGEWVLAIGNPFGLTHTVTAGIVSAKGRGEVGITHYADFIQTDAAINPGNSGGPLLNLKAEAVGLNTAIFSRSGGYMGIGFAIPINMVKFVTDQLINHGSISRGFLGVVIQDLTPDLATFFGVEEGNGVLLSDVPEGSPAYEAGLKRDDVVVEFDGQPVEDARSFSSRVASTAPGKPVKIVALRKGKRVKKTVTLGVRDDDDASPAPGKGSAGAYSKLGLTVQNLTDDVAGRLGYEGERGVVITEVEEGSAAAAKGLEPGILIQEVNRRAVNNTGEFKDAVKEAGTDKALLLLLKDGEYSRYVALDIGE